MPYALDTLQEIILGCAAQVAQQIRSAQQKAALQGQAPPAWAIGAKCQALDPLEATWQEATVKGISATGNFVLAFAGREDDLEEVLLAPSPCKERLGNTALTEHTATVHLAASAIWLAEFIPGMRLPSLRGCCLFGRLGRRRHRELMLRCNACI